jgi:hypothetical protein
MNTISATMTTAAMATMATVEAATITRTFSPCAAPGNLRGGCFLVRFNGVRTGPRASSTLASLSTHGNSATKPGTCSEGRWGSASATRNLKRGLGQL